MTKTKTIKQESLDNPKTFTVLHISEKRVIVKDYRGVIYQGLIPDNEQDIVLIKVSR